MFNKLTNWPINEIKFTRLLVITPGMTIRPSVKGAYTPINPTATNDKNPFRLCKSKTDQINQH